jgi:hypothetical protein
MGTSLFNTTPQNTYPSLIKLTDNLPLSGTLKLLSDGNGNDSVLALSTLSLQIGGATGATWDNTNKRLGIGTTTPLGILHLKSTAATTRMVMDGDTGQSKIITYRTAGLQRFGLYVNNTAESGSNAGSDFAIRAYNDAGTLLSTPLFIKRSTGNVGLGTTSPTGKLQVSGGDVRIFNVGTQIVLGSGIAGAYELGVSTGNRMDFSLSGTGTYLSILPTGGITFNGDTAAANALDDYEEGTFTPTTAGDATGAFSATNGEYTKIGNVVNFRLIAQISSNFTNNAIGGLPFTVGGSGSPSGVSGNINVANDNTANLVAFISVGSNSVSTYSDHSTINAISPTTGMGILRMFGTYRV